MYLMYVYISSCRFFIYSDFACKIYIISFFMYVEYQLTGVIVDSNLQCTIVRFLHYNLYSFRRIFEVSEHLMLLFYLYIFIPEPFASGIKRYVLTLCCGSENTFSSLNGSSFNKKNIIVLSKNKNQMGKIINVSSSDRKRWQDK